MNQKFDVAIMIFIMLNMITMCAEYSGQPDEYTEVCVLELCSLFHYPIIMLFFSKTFVLENYKLLAICYVLKI